MSRGLRGAALAMLAGAAFGLGCPAAEAALGEVATSLARDRQVLRADSVATVAMPLYDRLQLTTGDGVDVREFASRTGGGAVFAVRFDGPVLPDMRTILGTHYDHYVAAARVRQQRAHNRHTMSFDDDGLVVTIVKLPRGFSGEVHLPALVPQGVAVGALQ